MNNHKKKTTYIVICVSFVFMFLLLYSFIHVNDFLNGKDKNLHKTKIIYNTNNVPVFYPSAKISLANNDIRPFPVTLEINVQIESIDLNKGFILRNGSNIQYDVKIDFSDGFKTNSYYYDKNDLKILKIYVMKKNKTIPIQIKDLKPKDKILVLLTYDTYKLKLSRIVFIKKI